MADLLPLVSPVLLGKRLRRHREDRGESLDAAAERAQSLGFDLSRNNLWAIENGEGVPSDDHLQRVLDIYGLAVETLDQPRVELTLDSTEDPRWLESQLDQVGPARAMHKALARYVALLYLMRGETPGTMLRLRRADITMFATSYDRPPSVIEEELQRLMATSGGAPSWMSSVEERLSLPSAGVLVGVAQAGALVITVPS